MYGNHANWGNDFSPMCGKWITVNGPLGSVEVKITDICNDCGAGDLRLSKNAFKAIGNLDAGRINISWSGPTNVSSGTSTSTTNSQTSVGTPISNM